MTYPPKVIARVTLYAVRMDDCSNLELREWVLWEMGDCFTLPGFQHWKPLVAKDGDKPIYPWRRTRKQAVEAFVKRREHSRADHLARASVDADEIREARGLLEDGD